MIGKSFANDQKPGAAFRRGIQDPYELRRSLPRPVSGGLVKGCQAMFLFYGRLC
jgi:hypothetical protein